ncbi:MAG: hypothetical protein MH252_01900 [Thermosynechococcaceae cyanobacterium MS004]|nr:hypothetical protein [Thermosynechococcaceae cyanobacterium MS004]
MKLIQPISLGLLLSASLSSVALAMPRSTTTQIQGAPQPASLEHPGQKQSPAKSTGVGRPGILRGACPEGQQPSSWQKPIYDKAGLFVVGWETVATCIPEGLEPAG